MRIEMITAVESRNTESYTDAVAVYTFMVINDSIDLMEAIKMACQVYINTNSGLKEYTHNCHNFNWGDLDSIPNSFLRQFGFEKEDCTVAQTVVDFDEQLVTDDDLKFSDEKWKLLKKELFVNGTEALANFIGDNVPDDKDVVENLLDQVADQMPDEELYEFYSKYCLEQQTATEQRIQQLVKDMEAADALFIPSQEELEMDYFDHYEVDGEMFSGWFACRYDESCSTILAEFSDKPLITDEEIEKYGIDIRKVFDDHGIAYCG